MKRTEENTPPHVEQRSDRSDRDKKCKIEQNRANCPARPSPSANQIQKGKRESGLWTVTKTSSKDD